MTDHDAYVLSDPRTLIGAVTKLRQLVGKYNVPKLLEGQNVFLMDLEPDEASFLATKLDFLGLFVHISDSPLNHGKKTILTHLKE
jgi:hypothetical protein